MTRWGFLGEMGGGKCRFLGKSIDKGLQMLYFCKIFSFIAVLCAFAHGFRTMI